MKEKIIFIMNRGFVLYLVVGLILLFIIDYQIVAKRTLDYLGGDYTSYLIQYAKEEAPFDTETFKKAVRYYKNLLQLYPDAAVIYSAAGFCYHALGSPAKAIAYYEKAVNLDEKLFGLYYNLGVLHFENGSYSAAANYFKKVLSLPPDDAVLHGGAIFSKGSKGREEEIKAVYARCRAFFVLSSEMMKNSDSLPKETVHKIEQEGQKTELFFYLPIQGVFIQGKPHYTVM